MPHLPSELDLCVMSDITEVEGSTEENPKWKPVYYIGWPQELDAGIWGGSVSELFDTPEEAMSWFDENFDRLAQEQEEANGDD